MAARDNSCEKISLLYANHWVDSIQSKKQHITKVMVCEFVWRQNVGHVGKTLRLCGVHGHHNTMARRVSEIKLRMAGQTGKTDSRARRKFLGWRFQHGIDASH